MPATLTTIYTHLRDHFGPLYGLEAVRPWWPIVSADPPFEMLVGAVLVQQTRWETVEAAIARLHAADLLSPTPLAASDPMELAHLIRPAAFHTQKAPGLIAIARHIERHYGGSTTALLQRSTSELRAELLALPRIGRETCDVVMLYGGAHPIFVIDEYTRRLFERVQPELSSTQPAPAPWRQPYDSLRGLIETELSPSVGQPIPSSPHHSATGAPCHPVTRSPCPRAALYADYHAQINEACVRYCLSRPRCDGPPARRVYSSKEGRPNYRDRDDGCPLRAVCAFYKSQ
jgi:endonuclease III related protein